MTSPAQLRARVTRLERAMRHAKHAKPNRVSIHTRLADLQDRILAGDETASAALERIHAYLDRLNGEDEP